MNNNFSSSELERKISEMRQDIFRFETAKKEKETRYNNLKQEIVELKRTISERERELNNLENEIKKLAAFKRGQKIQLRDVQFLCRRSPASEIFKALDALSVGNKKKAAELLHHGVRSGDSPLYILSMVVYQLRNMLAVKELVERGKIKTAIIKETGLHPYVAQKTIACAGYFPLIKLKKIYQGLLRVDMGVKTGKLSPETALDILISRIN